MRYAIFLPLFLTSCTLSFHNISTHGTATDIVDENQEASPTVTAEVDVAPIKRLPGV